MTEEEIAALQASIAKLEANNARLTAELKTARKNSEITPEQLSQVEAERDKLLTDLSASQKQANDAVKNLELTSKQLQDVTEKGHRATIETDLTSALLTIGVKDEHYLTAVKALFSNQAKIGEDGKSLIGDKSLSEAIKEWGATDAAKHFQSAPDNNGGGSNGNKGGGNTPDLSHLKPTDRINAARAGAK